MCQRRCHSGNRFVRDKCLQVKTGIGDLFGGRRLTVFKTGFSDHEVCWVTNRLDSHQFGIVKTPDREAPCPTPITLNMARNAAIGWQNTNRLKLHIILVGLEPGCLTAREIASHDGDGGLLWQMRIRRHADPDNQNVRINLMAAFQCST